MKQKNPPRPQRRYSPPSPTPRTDTQAISVPNVVGTAFDTPGKMLAALRPYRRYEEVRIHMDRLLEERA